MTYELDTLLIEEIDLSYDELKGDGCLVVHDTNSISSYFELYKVACMPIIAFKLFKCAYTNGYYIHVMMTPDSEQWDLLDSDV